MAEIFGLVISRLDGNDFCLREEELLRCGYKVGCTETDGRTGFILVTGFGWEVLSGIVIDGVDDEPLELTV